MKTKIGVNGTLGAAASLGILLLTQSALSQTTNLQFTGVSATDEGNIQLTWASVSNEVYQIQEADALIDTNTGTTTWNLLYDQYPSQGTNTFWLDTGNYNLNPQILSPRDMPMRFYRIVDEGQDSLASDEPIVSISSPAANTAVTGELTISVTAATDQPILAGTKLYVDGQEMPPADSITNFVIGATNYEQDSYSINTSEWSDEMHVLFATAEAESGYGDVVGSGPVMTGHGVSPFVPVLFSNLITEISFSQPQFNPSLGETQQVSAAFTANCNWTLQIENIQNSNVVLTATGSGISMAYNWDGTGTGETNLPVGIYYFYISAETNGEPVPPSGSGSSSGGGSPPLPGLAMSDSSESWAVAPGSADALPLFLYPPGFDTNGFTIFQATPSQMSALRSSASSSSISTEGGGGFSQASMAGSSAASEAADAAPQRPPNNPTLGSAGTFGIVYDTYDGNGTNGYTFFPVPNEPGIPGSYVALNGYPSSTRLPYAPLAVYKTEANNFISEMQSKGWQCNINESDNQFSLSSMVGSGTPFNQVNLGVMMTHGAYGTSADYMAGMCEQMYFPITSASQYLRMSQMNLGGSGTNGLKWFAIMACNSLLQHNWNSMQNHLIYPYNNNLHLLLGLDSDGYESSSLMELWARYMNFSRGSYYRPQTIQNAWYDAAEDSYLRGNFTNSSIIFAVAGDSACMDDYVQAGYNSSPGGQWTYSSQSVWTHP